jgi:hypothetical protein
MNKIFVYRYYYSCYHIFITLSFISIYGIFITLYPPTIIFSDIKSDIGQSKISSDGLRFLL